MGPEAIVNAREEHLEEIRVLIESWLKVRSEPASVRDINNQYKKWELIYESYPFKFLPPELFHNPLFESLKEHIPDEELWQGFETWNSSLTDYLCQCFQLIEKLGKSVAKFSDCERTDDFIKPVFSQLDYFQKFRLWPDAPVFHTRKSALYVTIETEARVYCVLESDHPENHIVRYQSLIDSFLSGKDVANIRQIYLEVAEVATSVKDILKQALVSQSYFNHGCKICLLK